MALFFRMTRSMPRSTANAVSNASSTSIPVATNTKNNTQTPPEPGRTKCENKTEAYSHVLYRAPRAVGIQLPARRLDPGGLHPARGRTQQPRHGSHGRRRRLRLPAF